MVNLRSIEVDSGGHENKGCQIKVYIGVNDACSIQYEVKSAHKKDRETPTKKEEIHRNTAAEMEGAQIQSREICTTDFINGDGCDGCKGIDFDLRKLELSILNKKHEHEGLSTFCVIMKRFYPEEENIGNAQCRGTAKVDIIAGHQSGQGRISCPSKGKATDKEQGVNKRESSLRKERKKRRHDEENKKEKHIDQEYNQIGESNFAWRRVMTGINPYLVTIVAGFIALGSLFIIIT